MSKKKNNPVEDIEVKAPAANETEGDTSEDNETEGKTSEKNETEAGKLVPAAKPDIKIGKSYSVNDRGEVEEPEEIKRLKKKHKNTDTHSGVTHSPGIPDKDPDAVVRELQKKHFKEKK